MVADEYCISLNVQTLQTQMLLMDKAPSCTQRCPVVSRAIILKHVMITLNIHLVVQ